MPAVSEPKREVSVEQDDLVDSEVPAAVVCAKCGDAECPGCWHDESRSGVVAVVPWERPGAATFGRLWATARSSTLDAERFFESLPDGPLAPALRFAIVSELIAAAAMSLAVLAPIALCAPAWAEHVALYEGPMALRLAVIGIPAVAALLVVAHAVHGWALDWGSRRSGKRAVRRAIRFGLYATGWDIVVGPVGVVVVAFQDGLGAALAIGSSAVGLPRRSARAFLRGCYGLDGNSAGPALRASYVVAGIATIVGAAAVIAALVAAWIF